MGSRLSHRVLHVHLDFKPHSNHQVRLCSPHCMDGDTGCLQGQPQAQALLAGREVCQEPGAEQRRSGKPCASSSGMTLQTGVCVSGAHTAFTKGFQPPEIDTSSLTVSRDGQEKNCNLAVVQGYEHTMRLITCPCLSHCAPAQRVAPQGGKPQPGGPGRSSQTQACLGLSRASSARTLFLTERLDPFLHSSASKATLGSPTHSRRFLPCLEKRWVLFLRGLSDALLHPGESWCQGCPSNGSGHLPNTALLFSAQTLGTHFAKQAPPSENLEFVKPKSSSLCLLPSHFSEQSLPASMSVFRDGGHVFAKSFLFQDE